MRGHVCHGVLLENSDSLLVLIFVRRDFWPLHTEHSRETVWVPRLASGGGHQHVRGLLAPTKKLPLSSLLDFIMSRCFQFDFAK